MGCFCPTIGVSCFGLVGSFWSIFRDEPFWPDFLYKFQLLSFCLWLLWQLMPWTLFFFFLEGRVGEGGGWRQKEEFCFISLQLSYNGFMEFRVLVNAVCCVKVRIFIAK